jgi:aspartate 1-decarboxylase
MFLVYFMRIQILKSKLHRAKITEVHLDYEGSCAIDEDLLEAASINEYEMIHIYNLNNGNRFTTYAIKAEKGSGTISLNGAAAYQGNKNDLVIICTYAEIDQNRAKEHKPKLIYFKENSNIINEIKSQIPIQKNNVVSF